MNQNILDALSFYAPVPYPADILKDQIKKFPEIFTTDSLAPVLKETAITNLDEGCFISEKKSKYKNNYKRIFNPKQISSPFAASQIVEDPNDRVWIYIDEDDVIQGPFTTIEMDYWYNNHMFPMDLLIGLADRERCIRLGDFIIASYPFSKNPNLHIKRTAQELN